MKAIIGMLLPFLFIVGCGSSDNALTHYKKREALVSIPPFTAEEFCSLVTPPCPDKAPLRDKFSSLTKYVERMFPGIYFKPTVTSLDRPNELNPHVEVSTLHSINDPKDPPILFTSLGPDAQRVILERMEKTRSSKQDELKYLENLLWALRNEQPRPDQLSEEAKYDNERTVRLVISSSTNSTRPYDRLESVYAFLNIYKGAKIVDVKTPETERTKVDLGQYIYKSSSGLSGELGLQLPFTPASAKGGISREINTVLQRSLLKEFARRNISTNSDQDILFISQEAPMEGTDLSGNVVTSVTLELAGSRAAVSKFSRITTDEHGFIKKIEPEEYPFLNAGNVEAVFGWVAQARVVFDGGATIYEGDDIVRPVLYKGVGHITLWNNPSKMYFFGIIYGKTEQGCKLANLVYKEEGIGNRLIVFETPEEAKNFKKALLRHYEVIRPKFNPDKPAPLSLPGDIHIGFTVKPDGAQDDSALNIRWKDSSRKNQFVGLTDITFFYTTPGDFPLKSGHVQELPSNQCS